MILIMLENHSHTPSEGIAAEAADISAVLAASGIPFTRQRRLVWEYYLHVGKASTTAEAATDLRPAGVSQATVYRSACRVAPARPATRRCCPAIATRWSVASVAGSSSSSAMAISQSCSAVSK
jgi:hypothetical protein